MAGLPDGEGTDDGEAAAEADSDAGTVDGEGDVGRAGEVGPPADPPGRLPGGDVGTGPTVEAIGLPAMQPPTTKMTAATMASGDRPDAGLRSDRMDRS
jgi:hypothetical protein